MIDTIIKGTGNSRILKTVPNAAANYPDFASLLQALISGTFPIDIGPLNAAGCQVVGTPLDAAHIFEYAIGSYVGNGPQYSDQSANGPDDPKTLTFPFTPKVVIVVSSPTNRAYWYMPTIMIRPMTNVSVLKFETGTTFDILSVEWGDKTVSWYYNSTGGYNNSRIALNTRNVTYHYLAFG